MNAVLERASAPAADLQDGTSYGVLSPQMEDPFTLPNIAIPRWRAPTLRNFAEMAKDLRSWTGWSLRALSDALNTTHPTMRQILNGVPQAGTRNKELLRRIEQAHEVVARIYIVADRDIRRTAIVLTATSPSGRAVEYLASGEPSKAYLAALDSLRPEKSGGMLVGSRPLQPGAGTVDYLDPE